MVATTFAADTPLAVTGMVAENGIAGNWLWWSLVMSGMMTVFFYARLWRRAGVMTDIEFAELRYSGKPAAFLRGFRALYLGIPINCIILGWVNLAMIKIIKGTLGVDAFAAVVILIGILLFTAFYTTISGLWGVLVTDLFQFALKMGMVILLAVFAVNAVGGIEGLKEKVIALDATSGQSGSRLDFFPPLNSAWMPAITLVRVLGRQLVGQLVSGRGTGRRRIRCPANFFGKERAARRVGHAVVQRGSLFAATLAMDSYGARLDRSLSGAER